jgi:hypothetical protein
VRADEVRGGEPREFVEEGSVDQIYGDGGLFPRVMVDAKSAAEGIAERVGDVALE